MLEVEKVIRLQSHLVLSHSSVYSYKALTKAMQSSFPPDLKKKKKVGEGKGVKN